jgi:hypothetical protein
MRLHFPGFLETLPGPDRGRAAFGLVVMIVLVIFYGWMIAAHFQRIG